MFLRSLSCRVMSIGFEFGQRLRSRLRQADPQGTSAARKSRSFRNYPSVEFKTDLLRRIWISCVFFCIYNMIELLRYRHAATYPVSDATYPAQSNLGGVSFLPGLRASSRSYSTNRACVVSYPT
jgi:hypothetical protein